MQRITRTHNRQDFFFKSHTLVQCYLVLINEIDGASGNSHSPYVPGVNMKLRIKKQKNNRNWLLWKRPKGAIKLQTTAATKHGHVENGSISVRTGSFLVSVWSMTNGDRCNSKPALIARHVVRLDRVSYRLSGDSDASRRSLQLTGKSQVARRQTHWQFGTPALRQLTVSIAW